MARALLQPLELMLAARQLRVTAPCALRNATVMAACVAGCARGGMERIDARLAPDTAVDAPRQARDAAPDAHLVSPDAPPACAISAGMSPALDGTGDMAKYPSGQHVTLGAMLGSDDAAVAWDKEQLYITVTSSAFTSAYEPLHVYLEAASGLGVAVPSQGKEYSGLVPQLPFTPTHLVAARNTSAGYDAVYTPASTWDTVAMPLASGTDVWLSSDSQTLSLRVPWTALGGCPTHLRLAAHVVHAVTGNEWKDLAPATATPWQAPGGGYYEIDLTGSTAVASWALH